MPKQKPNILQRLRISLWFVARKREFGLIECCGVCGSMKVIRKKIRENKQIYYAKYKCLDCGAIARSKEKWRSGGATNAKVRG